jgi:hypothetical protein
MCEPRSKASPTSLSQALSEIARCCDGKVDLDQISTKKFSRSIRHSVLARLVEASAVPRLISNETSTQQLDLDLESHRVSESKLFADPSS